MLQAYGMSHVGAEAPIAKCLSAGGAEAFRIWMLHLGPEVPKCLSVPQARNVFNRVLPVALWGRGPKLNLRAAGAEILGHVMLHFGAEARKFLGYVALWRGSF